VATGASYYFTYCVICHGGMVNPNLPRSPVIADKDAFQQIVIKGAFAPNGMPSFAPYLKPEEAEGVRAYLNQQAREILVKEAAPARVAP
jgi:mono/diheme cytochrome c family protein